MILFIGVLVFVFYLFNQPPVFHNVVLKEQAAQTGQRKVLDSLEQQYDTLYYQKRQSVDHLVDAIHTDDAEQIRVFGQKVKNFEIQEKELRDSVRSTIAAAIPGAKVQDRDYIFLNFVLQNLPNGIIGLLLAVIFSAAMSSMASELNALASTTTIDIYKRACQPKADSLHYLRASQWFTVLWALLAMVFAMLASFAENLIQFVNIVGSLFYGTILGIFLTAFYIKRVQSTPVFWAAVVAECSVLSCYFWFQEEIAFLLYNIIGCAIVILLSLIFQVFSTRAKPDSM
jgi:Na+(H+)/acetate symporter ActP